MIEQQKQEFFKAIQENNVDAIKCFVSALEQEDKEIVAPIFQEALNQAIFSSSEDIQHKEKTGAVFYILDHFFLLLKNNDNNLSSLECIGNQEFKKFQLLSDGVQLKFSTSSLKSIFVLPYSRNLLEYIFNKMTETQKNLMAILALLAQVSALKELSYTNHDWVKTILLGTHKKTSFLVKHITDLNIPKRAPTTNMSYPREAEEKSFYNKFCDLLTSNSPKKLDREIEVFFKFIEINLRAHPSLLKNINWKNAFFQEHEFKSENFLLSAPSPKVG